MSSFSSKPNKTPQQQRTSVAHHYSPRSNDRELSDDQRHEISEAFELFSIQSAGVLNYHELKVALRALGFDLKKAEVHKILKDNSPDGKRITENKFAEYAERAILSRDPIDELKRAFRLFDSDGNGKIVMKDMRRVAADLGEQLQDEELQAMLDEFSNINGDVTETEFIEIMMDG